MEHECFISNHLKCWGRTTSSILTRKESINSSIVSSLSLHFYRKNLSLILRSDLIFNNLIEIKLAHNISITIIFNIFWDGFQFNILNFVQKYSIPEVIMEIMCCLFSCWQNEKRCKLLQHRLALLINVNSFRS